MKQNETLFQLAGVLSHLVEVRGLKHIWKLARLEKIRSHLVEMRGLKRIPIKRDGQRQKVAPRRGAWIETKMRVINGIFSVVAPRRGAWIETLRIGSKHGVGHRRTS